MCSGLDAVGCAKKPAKTRSFISWANSASKWSLDHILKISFKSANSFLVKYSPAKSIFLRHYLRNTFKACIFGTRPRKTVLSTPKETLSHTFGPHWTPGSGSIYFIFENFWGQFHKTVFRIRCRRLCKKSPPKRYLRFLNKFSPDFCWVSLQMDSTSHPPNFIQICQLLPG